MALRAPILTLSGNLLIQHEKPIVYAWKRNGDFLYVGYSTRGLGRLFSHNVINVVEAVEESDTFEIYSFQEVNEAALFEHQLILEKLPKYNVEGKPEKGTKFVCLVCGTQFEPTRQWQRFCSTKCRNQRTPQPRPKVALEFTCEFCGDKFTAKRATARFCSKECRFAAWDKAYPRDTSLKHETTYINSEGTMLDYDPKIPKLTTTTNELSNTHGNPISG